MAIRSTFFGLEIARTGLTVSQQGLNVTTHNIANVDTPGYTRQRIVNSAYEPYAYVTQFRPVSNALIGGGTKVVVLDQIRSSFLDRQFRSENSLASYWEARTEGLTYVESLLEDTGDGSLAKSLGDFISALNTGTTEATDREQRIALQQAAKNLCENFNIVYDRLAELQVSQNTAVEALVDQINTIAENIAVLNKSIVSYEMTGQIANDLRDKRNLLLDELSSYVDIEYTIDSSNYMTITIGGEELVSHVTVNKLALDNGGYGLDDQTVLKTPVWAATGVALDFSKMTGGELKAHMDLRDGADEDNQGIPYYAEQLNILARVLAKEINEQHAKGYTFDGSQGGNFFDEPAGGYDNITAKNFKLDQSILDSVYNIAFSSEEVDMTASGGDTNAANQENLKAIYALFNKADHKYGSIDIGSFEGFLDGIVLDIAITLKHSKDMTDTKNTLRASVDTQRTSMSGVSLDEEMTNMIKYQHAYNAASRMITTMDEALDKIINAMGRVGL